MSGTPAINEKPADIKGFAPMMTGTEIQLASYAESILRHRGYLCVADDLKGVIATEVDRWARLLAPPEISVQRQARAPQNR